jgi:hypothetical protein
MSPEKNKKSVATSLTHRGSVCCGLLAQLDRPLDDSDCKCALRFSSLCSNKPKLDGMCVKNMGPLAADVHREEAEIAARADATLLTTRSMAKSVELGMTMSGARRVR